MLHIKILTLLKFNQIDIFQRAQQKSHLNGHKRRHLDLRARKERDPLAIDLENIVCGRRNHLQNLRKNPQRMLNHPQFAPKSYTYLALNYYLLATKSFQLGFTFDESPPCERT